MQFDTFYKMLRFQSVSRCKLRTAKSLNNEGKEIMGLAKIRQETPQVKNLWKRLRNWKGDKSMAFGDDPLRNIFALCAV